MNNYAIYSARNGHKPVRRQRALPKMTIISSASITGVRRRRPTRRPIFTIYLIRRFGTEFMVSRRCSRCELLADKSIFYERFLCEERRFKPAQIKVTTFIGSDFNGQLHGNDADARSRRRQPPVLLHSRKHPLYPSLPLPAHIPCKIRRNITDFNHTNRIQQKAAPSFLDN